MTRDPLRRSRSGRFIVEKHAFALRLASVMIFVSLATFGALVGTYKLLF